MLNKITKTQLKSILNSLEIGETVNVWLCPSKCYPNPNHPFNTAIMVKLERNGEWWKEMKEYRDIETIIDNFHYYNCNNETGKRVHFYIEK